MQVLDGHSTARRFFTNENARSYEDIVKFATLFQDAAWKTAISKITAGFDSVLDLACGTGLLSSAIELVNPRTIHGLDLTYSYLEKYNCKFPRCSVQATAESVPFKENSFDAVVSSYLAKYVNSLEVVKEGLRVLRPGGILVFHDFTRPKNGLVLKIWRTYLGLLYNLAPLTKSWRIVFDELESVISQSNWAVQIGEAMAFCGCREITVKHVTFGTACIISGKKP